MLTIKVIDNNIKYDDFGCNLRLFLIDIDFINKLIYKKKKLFCKENLSITIPFLKKGIVKQINL